jgi:four helix bundle protein
MKTHKDLDVWRKGVEFVTLIYQSTSPFPKEELYGLTSQIRRSAVSIPSNIAEGAARNHDKEFLQFLYIALASASELETQLIIANNLGFMNNDKSKELMNELNIISKMLQGLIKSVK